MDPGAQIVYSAVTALGCELTLVDGELDGVSGLMLNLRMPQPDGRFAQVWLSDDDARNLRDGLEEIL